MSRRSDDDSASLSHPLAEATTDVVVESGSDGSAGGEDSGEEAIAKLGLEALAELERLRARLGLLDGDGDDDGDGDGDDDDDEEPAGPRVIGRYRLRELIGRGGMGVVYRAHDPELGRAVAIKLVHAPAFSAPEKLRNRLLREAKLLAKLAHPNVVRVYDCGQHEGEVYLAMEHVQGTTLREWQIAEPRTTASLVDAYVAAAAGLGAAHDLGIVHRDFKPDNVLVADDGRILVGDFGLAVGGVEEVLPVEGEGDPEPEAAGVLATMTKTGALLGTVLYMAPEQLRGEPATALSDQFAFCVALWEALAGRRPFEGDDQAGLLAAIEKGRPAGGERIPKKLRRALERGLSVDPAERHPSIGTLAAALRGKRGISVGAALTVVVASIGLGLLAYPLVFASAPPVEECELERAVIEVRGSEAWAGVHGRLDEAGVGVGLDRLEQHLERLETEAQALCKRTGPGDEARRQHLQSWVESLGSLLDTAGGRAMGDLLEDIEELEHARLTTPPPRALDERVVAARDESWDLERRGDLTAALEAAKRAVSLADDRSLELSVAEPRHGRLLALLGRPAEAMQAYGAATSAAEASSYDHARLETRLLAARTAIMRLEQLDRGQDALDDVRGLLVRLDEPWPSPRRASYDELRAAVLKRQRQWGPALAEQWKAVLQHSLLGSTYDTGLAYVNLGTIYERRGQSEVDLQLARASYEHALALLAPTRPSANWGAAAYGLGHWLVGHGAPEELARAEQLLEDVRLAEPEYRRRATEALLIAGMQRGPEVDLGPLAQEWLVMLREQPPASPRAALDAWTIAGAAAAHMGDWDAYQRAFGEVEAFAAELVRTGVQSPAEGVVSVASVQVQAAQLFAAVDPARTQMLARAAQERLVALPAEDRPADLMQAIEEILAG